GPEDADADANSCAWREGRTVPSSDPKATQVGGFESPMGLGAKRISLRLPVKLP
ncbi:MAG: hypothetical protein QOJ05_1976, partial [Verrucomicrobiota bacterium]